MSVKLACIILASVTILAATPAQAQTYNPSYPICMKRYQWGGSVYNDCRFTSMAQCAASASGLPAMCLIMINPYFEGGYRKPPGRTY